MQTLTFKIAKKFADTKFAMALLIFKVHNKKDGWMDLAIPSTYIFF